MEYNKSKTCCLPFNGQNGLDLITSIYLIRTFIQPILAYSLEIILPTSQNIEKLEKFQRQLLKKILTLSINTPDSAIFIVTGFLPVIAQIERKALTIFNNICRQKDNAIEKRIGLRQLTVKDMDSNSWFIAIKKMLYKYKLLDPITLMNNPPRKLEWKNLSILHSTNTGQTC